MFPIYLSIFVNIRFPLICLIFLLFEVFFFTFLIFVLVFFQIFFIKRQPKLSTYKKIILFINIRNIRSTSDGRNVWRLYGSLNGLLNSVYVVSAWWFEATRRIAFMSNTWEMDNGWSVDYRLTFKLQMTYSNSVAL